MASPDQGEGDDGSGSVGSELRPVNLVQDKVFCVDRCSHLRREHVSCSQWIRPYCSPARSILSRPVTSREITSDPHAGRRAAIPPRRPGCSPATGGRGDTASAEVCDPAQDPRRSLGDHLHGAVRAAHCGAWVSGQVGERRRAHRCAELQDCESPWCPSRCGRRRSHSAA